MMKKIVAFLVLCVTLCSALFASGNSESGGDLRIGIAKITAHPALDAIEQGIIDELTERNISASYDLQNANGDINSAMQIANKFKSDKVAIAVGIATPVAIALANTIKDVPVIFATVTDPIEAGLVSTVEHGENNVTGLSDAIPTADHIALFKKITGIKTLGYIYTSSEANSVSSLRDVEAACAKQGVALVTQAITNSAEIKQAAETIVNRVDGLYLTTDNTVFSALASLTQVFGDAKKPIFSADVTGAMDGGCVIASGFNYYKAGRATGVMVADALAGKPPAETPVKFITDPEESDFLIDLDAAANCGVAIPEELLNLANMIYENGALTYK